MKGLSGEVEAGRWGEVKRGSIQIKTVRKSHEESKILCKLILNIEKERSLNREDSGWIELLLWAISLRVIA